jgi:hypothetical protein
MEFLSRRAMNDDLTYPGVLEQSTVPGSPFDAPGHLAGVALLACGALKEAAVGQSLWKDAMLGH